MTSHTAEKYREAAREHVEVARRLDQTRHYGAAHYWAGLAVECMLRAYCVREDPVFDSRHDLAVLAKEARFYAFVPPKRVREVTAAVATVVERWSNDHRYRPERMVERWLREHGVDRTVKGDRLKYSSRQITQAAWFLVEVGELSWTLRR